MAALPITIIGGYLGTGKTTLVNHLLRHADGLRLAVLVNEFGSLSIDEDLIVSPVEDNDTGTTNDSKANRNLISIAGGCVCCSYGNDLSLALMDLLALDPMPDHVVLESSGVALPGAIAASVSLLSGYAVDGIVVLANAETIQEQAADTYIGDTISRQIEHADLLVLNKTDLVEPAQTEKTLGWLQQAVPGAKVVCSEHAKLPPEILMQSFMGRERKTTDGHHALNLFKTVTLALTNRLDATALAKMLAEHCPQVVRAKGFAKTVDGATVAIQVVGRRWDVTEVHTDTSLNLVVIGQTGNFDETSIRKAVAKYAH